MNVYIADFPGDERMGSAVIIASSFEEAQEVLESELMGANCAAELSDCEWTIHTAEDDEPVLAFFDSGEAGGY